MGAVWWVREGVFGDGWIIEVGSDFGTCLA